MCTLSCEVETLVCFFHPSCFLSSPPLPSDSALRAKMKSSLATTRRSSSISSHEGGLGLAGSFDFFLALNMPFPFYYFSLRFAVGVFCISRFLNTTGGLGCFQVVISLAFPTSKMLAIQLETQILLDYLLVSLLYNEKRIDSFTSSYFLFLWLHIFTQNLPAMLLLSKCCPCQQRG